MSFDANHNQSFTNMLMLYNYWLLTFFGHLAFIVTKLEKGKKEKEFVPLPKIQRHFWVCYIKGLFTFVEATISTPNFGFVYLVHT